MELYTHDPEKPTVTIDSPIGLDGLYRKGNPTVRGVLAVKARWLDRHTFDIDVQYLGAGEQRQWLLSFEGEKLNLRGKDRQGREISIDGRVY